MRWVRGVLGSVGMWSRGEAGTEVCNSPCPVGQSPLEQDKALSAAALVFLGSPTSLDSPGALALFIG